MKKLYFLFLFSSVITYGQTQIGADIDGEAEYDVSGSSVSLSSNGTILAIGATGNDDNGLESGQVRVYRNNTGVWIQIGADINGETAYDETGFSVSLSGDGTILAIGAIYNNGNGVHSGQVRVYRNISDNWIQIGSDIDGETANDLNGSSVSLSNDGTILAIGAVGNNGNGSLSGQVRVYRNISDNWIQIGSDINGEDANDYSGTSISLSSDGTILAIGANGNNGNGPVSGHVRVFKNISDNWIQIGADIDGETASDGSGFSVSLSSDGTILAIGAISNNGNGSESGHVRVFKNISNNWIQVGADINGEDANNLNGWSVSLSSDGTILAIGAIGNNGNGPESGQVRVFKNISDSWIQIGIDINGEGANDQSGQSVSLSSDGIILAIGALGNDGSALNSGHVRVFDLSAVLASDTFVLDNFSIYPNPTSDILNITLENNITLEKVTIYTTLGQIIKLEKSKTIDVKSLAKGNYFVEVITNQGKATKTIIIE